jgi:hypothetical protein
MAQASIAYRPTAGGGSVSRKWSGQSVNFRVLKLRIHEALHHSRARLNTELFGHARIYEFTIYTA